MLESGRFIGRDTTATPSDLCDLIPLLYENERHRRFVRVSNFFLRCIERNVEHVERVIHSL